MITKNAPFIKALRKLFLEYGVEITQYGNHADESLAFFFTGDEVDVLIEQGIFEGCDLTPEPKPEPPPPVIVEKIVEKEVIVKLNVNKATLDALKGIKDFYNRKDNLTSGKKAYYMYDIARKALKVVD